MATRDLGPLLNPRSIAVIGASPTSRVGLNMVRNLLQLGYPGRIYPVNPRYDGQEILGLPCYANLSTIPAEVEAVMVGVATKYVVPTIEEAAVKGVRAATIGTAGFAEVGEEGRLRQEALQRIAREAGMAICGPNCMGLISFANRQAMYSGGIPTNVATGNVAVISQSGSVAIGLLTTGRLALSHLVSSGNEAVVDLAEYLDYFLDDPQTEVMAAFVEGLRAPDRFLAVAERARELGKPVIILKVGASEKAAAATMAHTAALAGSSRVFDAVCRQKGIIRVDDMDELIETAAIFSGLRGRRPKGRRIGSTTASGGQVGLVLDVAASLGIEYQELTEQSRAALGQILPSTPSLTNPLDAWGVGNVKEDYPRCLEVLAADERVDVVAVCQDAPRTVDEHMVGIPLQIAKFTAALAEKTEKPVVFFTTFSSPVDPPVVEVLAAAGVPLLLGTREGLKAIDRYIEYHEQLQRPIETAGAPGDHRESGAAAKALAGAGPVLSERQSLQVLASCGIPVAPHELVDSAEAAANTAEALGFPVAVKVCSPDLPHKTEAGAVRLNLADRMAVQRAYDEVLANVSRVAPQARIEGVLVQKMIGGVELIAGIKRDSAFGPVVLLGIGGIFVEVLRDVSLRLAPLRRRDAEAMIQELRGRALLEGHRGLPAVDKSAIVQVLLGLSRLAREAGDRLDQVDINPLIVSDQGARAADALIIQRPVDSAARRELDQALVD